MLSHKPLDLDDCESMSQNSIILSSEDSDASGPSSATVSTTDHIFPTNDPENSTSNKSEAMDNDTKFAEKDANQKARQPINIHQDKDHASAFEEKADLGLIFNILKRCLTQRQAAYGVIFLALILNASDASSDYSTCTTLVS